MGSPREFRPHERPGALIPFYIAVVLTLLVFGVGWYMGVLGWVFLVLVLPITLLLVFLGSQ